MPDHEALLKSVSRSFYLSLRFLPTPMRGPVSLAYLLARLSDTIADTPGISEVHRLALLEDWRAVLEGRAESYEGDLSSLQATLTHSGERVLVSRIDELVASYRGAREDCRGHLAEVLLTILEGQIWDLQAFSGSVVACAQGEDLLRYAYWVAGSVGEFWTKTAFTVLGERFADPTRRAEMLVSGRQLGQALQLINILRDLHEDLPRGRCYLPEEELRAAGWDGASPLHTAQVEPVFVHWLGVCRSYLEGAESYVKLVRDGRVKFCTRLPALLASATADRLEAAGCALVMQEKVKISRVDVWKAMGEAFFL